MALLSATEALTLADAGDSSTELAKVDIAKIKYRHIIARFKEFVSLIGCCRRVGQISSIEELLQHKLIHFLGLCKCLVFCIGFSCVCCYFDFYEALLDIKAIESSV